jgi:hypothetical protein
MKQTLATTQGIKTWFSILPAGVAGPIITSVAGVQFEQCYDRPIRD